MAVRRKEKMTMTRRFREEWLLQQEAARHLLEEQTIERADFSPTGFTLVLKDGGEFNIHVDTHGYLVGEVDPA